MVRKYTKGILDDLVGEIQWTEGYRLKIDLLSETSHLIFDNPRTLFRVKCSFTQQEDKEAISLILFVGIPLSLRRGVCNCHVPFSLFLPLDWLIPSSHI